MRRRAPSFAPPPQRAEQRDAFPPEWSAFDGDDDDNAAGAGGGGDRGGGDRGGDPAGTPDTTGGARRAEAWWRRWALVDVRADTREHARVRAQLNESMPHVALARLERVQHRRLWRRFADRSEELASKCADLQV